MELQITCRNMQLVEEARRYIERKLGRLNRHLPNITESKVEVAEEKTRAPQHRFVVQMTVDSQGTLLRAEERGEDLFTAVDKAAEIMNRQIEHYKGKLYDRGRGNSPDRNESGDRTELAAPVVIKTKRFGVKPMPVAEAIDQMELLGHDFFLFFNAESERIGVVYRRKDGNYGLIEPEVG